MDITLRYGRDGLKATLPDDRVAGVLRMRPLPVIDDVDAAVRDALRSPMGSSPLSELARGRRSAVIVVCDVTRPVPNRSILPPLLQTLHEAGLSRDDVTILVATGLHRPNVGHELDEMIGENVSRRYRVINHDGRDDASHAYLGETRSGTPVHIDRAYVDADLKILTGLAEPHLMAGYSGGRKVACPGLGSWRTVSVLHSPRFLEHPGCRPGRLDDNPLHRELLEIARMAGVDFILNVTLDEERRVTGLFAGDMEAAHRAATARVDEGARIPVEHPADVVLTTSAGYPLDATFSQCVKGMTGALPAVKPGGTLILAAALSEGVGGEEFRKTLFSRSDFDVLADEIRGRDHVEIDQWQIEELALARRHAKITVCTDGLDAMTLRLCHVDAASSVEEALDRALREHGPDAKMIVIPEGPYVLPCAARS